MNFTQARLLDEMNCAVAALPGASGREDRLLASFLRARTLQRRYDPAVRRAEKVQGHIDLIQALNAPLPWREHPKPANPADHPMLRTQNQSAKRHTCSDE